MAKSINFPKRFGEEIDTYYGEGSGSLDDDIS